jgi:hypothetical protein
LHRLFDDNHVEWDRLDGQIVASNSHIHVTHALPAAGISFDDAQEALRAAAGISANRQAAGVCMCVLTFPWHFL